MSQSKDKAFKDLQRQWYKKLKKSGFDDIEKDEDNLKSWSSDFFRRHKTDHKEYHREYNEDKFKAHEEYYRMAEEFLTNYHFENSTDRFIWSQHAEAVSIREIVRMLKVKRIKSYKFKVHETIKRLKRLMFLGLGRADDR